MTAIGGQAAEIGMSRARPRCAMNGLHPRSARRRQPDQCGPASRDSMTVWPSTSRRPRLNRRFDRSSKFTFVRSKDRTFQWPHIGSRIGWRTRPSIEPAVFFQVFVVVISGCVVADDAGMRAERFQFQAILTTMQIYVHTHVMSERSFNAEFRTCACANLRMAGRAITREFDNALQPLGLKSTQFTVLAMLAGLGGTPMGRLAEALVMDRTSLTRILKPLCAREFVHVHEGEDRRVRNVELTKKGRAVLADAEPLWRSEQQRIVEGLGHDRFANLISDLSAVIDLTMPD